MYITAGYFQNDKGLFFFWLVPVLICVSYIYVLYRAYKIKLIIERLPRSKSDSAAAGQAEFQGYNWSSTEGLLESPLFGEKCLAFETNFYEGIFFDKRDENAVINLKKATIAQSKPFFILDETGMVLIEANQNISYLDYFSARKSSFANFSPDKKKRIVEFLKIHRPKYLKNLASLVVSERILTERSVCYLNGAYSRGVNNMANQVQPTDGYVEFLNGKRDEYYKSKLTDQISTWNNLFEPSKYTKRITKDNYSLQGSFKRSLNSEILVSKRTESQMQEINGGNFFLKMTAASVILLILLGIPFFV